MSSDAFSTVLRQNVLAPWHAARLKLAAQRRLTGLQPRYLTYLEAREEAWQALLAAVSSDSPSDLATFKDLNANADTLLHELLNGK